jgi:2-keto-4-pentenoate hydratase/2-oxohepta-3-ene-1,7-dioic acid hydratase in catechol pathway
LGEVTVKTARVLYQGQSIWAVLDGETAYALEGDRFSPSPGKGATLGPVSSLKLLFPLDPTNQIVALFGGWAIGDRDGPGIFIKPYSSLISTGESCDYPDVATTVFMEPELATVIGKRCSHVSAKDAKDYILGYTCVNDTTVFESKIETTFPHIWGKMFDGFGNAGPIITDEIDPKNATIRAALNGEEFLTINSSLLAWDVYEVVEWVSKVVTLNPGDLISMGAPPGFDKLSVNRGDVMKVTIDGIGSIESHMRK